MLILWQDQVAVEVHAEAVASAEVHSVEVQEAEEDSAEDPLAVHTAVASAAHTMVALLAVPIVAILEDIITIITALIFTDRSDRGAVFMSVAVSAVAVSL